MAVPEGVVQNRIQISSRCKPHVSCCPDCQMRCVVRKGLLAPGEPHPIHIDKADIPDGPPRDRELRSVVWGLQNGCAVGVSGLQAEHIKVWLRDAVRKEEEDGDVGLGDKWCKFVRLMQAIWEHGRVPKQMR